MNSKILKNLKIISFLCIIFLVIEIIYVGYSLMYNKESLYFDGVNALTSDGKSYIAVGSNNNNDYKYEKAILSKYNSKKEKVFEKIYNKGYNGAFFDVEFDGDFIIAVGSYEKDESDHNNSVRSALLVKYDINGDIVFENDLSILDNSKFTSVTVVDDGYLVTGQSVYKSTKIGSKEGGAVLIKYDKDGKMLWKSTYGNNKSAVFNNLIVLNDSIYTVGVDDNYLGLICKYNLDGEFITYNDYKWTDIIGFSDICNIGDKIYVCGANRSGDNWTNSMIVEYDTDCTYIKETVYESDGINRFNKMQVDSNDNIIVIGSLKLNKSSKDSVDVFNYDAIIGKYKDNLEKVSIIKYGDEKDDFFTDITIVDKNYLVSGYSSYEDGSYLSKFLKYSEALKLLGVE